MARSLRQLAALKYIKVQKQNRSPCLHALPLLLFPQANKMSAFILPLQSVGCVSAGPSKVLPL